MESTAKQKVPEPAARPSTPSVMLTAFDVPTMTTTAKTTQPTWPRLMPMHVGPGERQRSRRVRPVHRQLGEGEAHSDLRS